MTFEAKLILIVFSPVMIRTGLRNGLTLSFDRFGNGSEDKVLALKKREFCTATARAAGVRLLSVADPDYDLRAFLIGDPVVCASLRPPATI